MSQHAVRDRIDRLESLTGDGTELVSLTIPAGDALAAARDRIADEHASAERIRSDQTRTRVERALGRVQGHLRAYEATPECGLAVYAGVVDGDLRSAVFDELPDPLTDGIYRCDDHFHLEPVRDAVAPGDVYGLLVVERGGAALGRLVGDRVLPVRTLESQVMGSSRAGGQSAKRFERERERQAHEFFDRVGDVADATFIDGADTVTGLLVGGSLSTATQFVDGDYLDYRLRERLLGPYSVDYATERGLDELVATADEAVLDAESRAVRQAVETFFERLRSDDPVVYGDEELDRAIAFGAVDTALVSTAVEDERRDAIERVVSERGGETLVVPTTFGRGARFAETFRVGALPRFRVE